MSKTCDYSIYQIPSVPFVWPSYMKWGLYLPASAKTICQQNYERIHFSHLFYFEKHCRLLISKAFILNTIFFKKKTYFVPLISNLGSRVDWVSVTWLWKCLLRPVTGCASSHSSISEFPFKIDLLLSNCEKAPNLSEVPYL